jgi:hypothetical protein
LNLVTQSGRSQRWVALIRVLGGAPRCSHRHGWLVVRWSMPWLVRAGSRVGRASSHGVGVENRLVQVGHSHRSSTAGLGLFGVL